MPIRKKDGSLTYRLIAESRCTDWIATVRHEAKVAMKKHPPFQGPVSAHLEFRFPRPKSHYRGGKIDPDRLRKDASSFVIRRPDLDKLCRAVLDALTGVVWVDDALIAQLAAVKCYDDAPGVLIVVSSAQGRLYGFRVSTQASPPSPHDEMP